MTGLGALALRRGGAAAALRTAAPRKSRRAAALAWARQPRVARRSDA